jgi:hypothetical protein
MGQKGRSFRCIFRAGQAVAMPDARSGALSGDHLRSYMLEGTWPGEDERCLQNSTSRTILRS